MRSIGNGGVTIVTVLILIFTTWFGSDGSVQKRLVDVKVQTHVERCGTGKPCPRHRLVIETVMLRVTVGSP